LAEKITSNLKFKIKSEDDKNPIPSTQKPRGYGGTAIAWKKEINHLIDDNIEEGNERIVCIRIKVKPTPILIVSVYKLFKIFLQLNVAMFMYMLLCSPFTIPFPLDDWPGLKNSFLYFFLLHRCYLVIVVELGRKNYQ
jgi:hypothetical protein